MRERQQRRRRPPLWTAILAAYVLFLRALVAGAVDGALAAPRDGGVDLVLCTHLGGAAPGSPNDPRHGSHLPECCLLGCSMVGGHATAAAAPVLADFVPAAWVAATLPRPESVAAARFDRSPANPRAPPLPA
jgi:hypothetical protein